MTGFGRLFADDTCIGHMAHKEENLHTLISTDLEYLNAWSYRWLVKFNPNKTDIMISFCGSERGVVSLDEFSFFINIFMIFQYNLPLADFNSSKFSFIFA
jgi:hypothetical protein